MNDKTYGMSRLRKNTFVPDRYCACDSRFFKRDEGVLRCWTCGKLVQSPDEPAQAEPMKVREPKIAISANTLKTHCPKGHPYDAANTYNNTSGGRECKECKAYRREQEKRKRAEMKNKSPRWA